MTFADDVSTFPARTMVLQRTAASTAPGATPELAPEATPLGEVYQFRISSDRHDLYQLRSEMQWNVVRVLRQAPGVADIVPFGGYLKEVHVEADPARLFAWASRSATSSRRSRNRTSTSAAAFCARRPGDHGARHRLPGIRRGHQAHRAEEQGRHGGHAGDVAHVVQSYTPRRGTVGVGLEREGIESFVWMRPRPESLAGARGIHAKIRELHEPILPKGMQIETFYDRSDLVGLTLRTVHENLLTGFSLVVGVVWLFLRSVVGSAVVPVVIPLSLLVAFLGLYLLGLPANLISMGAIDFGILVDGAVVLVENVIHALRHEHPADRRGVLRLVVRSRVDVGRPDALRHADHHRRAGARIHAAVRRGPHLPSAGAHLFLRARRRAGVLADAGAGAVRGAVPPASTAAGSEEPPGSIAAARATARPVAGCSSAGGSSGRGLRCSGAGRVTSRAGTEFLPELDEGDIQLFVEMPPASR
jgi:cobalt-zinc-cadmium resistance protein CzcA